jgi:hypothetical protein
MTEPLRGFMKKICMILLAVVFAVPAGAQEMRIGIETFTTERREPNSWSTQKRCCYYAKSGARNLAKARCKYGKTKAERDTNRKIKNKVGEYIKPKRINKKEFVGESCKDYKRTKSSKNWKCTGVVKSRCKTMIPVVDVEEEGVIRKMRRKVSPPRLKNPCDEDGYSSACRRWRQGQRQNPKKKTPSSGGVSGGVQG